MSDRQRQILGFLILGPRTSSEISHLLGDGVPEPSIRRDIQALRRAGYNISFASNYGDGIYRL